MRELKIRESSHTRSACFGQQQKPTALAPPPPLTPHKEEKGPLPQEEKGRGQPHPLGCFGHIRFSRHIQHQRPELPPRRYAAGGGFGLQRLAGAGGKAAGEDGVPAPSEGEGDGAAEA